MGPILAEGGGLTKDQGAKAEILKHQYKSFFYESREEVIPEFINSTFPTDDSPQPPSEDGTGDNSPVPSRKWS